MENIIDTDQLSGIVKVKDYRCPKCNLTADDSDGGYNVSGIEYPKYLNERRGSTMYGDYLDWDEIHKCRNCKTVYWFSNGAY